MNSCIIVGNVCKEPEAYTTQSGVSRSSFKVAVQRRFANAQGQREADFLPIVAWRGTADYCNKYLKKGDKVAIEGSIQTRSYDAQDGSKRYVTEIIADNVETVKRASDGTQGGDNVPRQQAAPQSSMPDNFTEVDPGDELPF